MRLSLIVMWLMDAWTWNCINRREVYLRSGLKVVAVMMLPRLYHPISMVVFNRIRMWASGDMWGHKIVSWFM